MYREIMRNKGLTPEAKAIYAYLCSFAGSGTSCYPSADLMRSELQMGTDRFYKHMRLLTDAGIVRKIQERKGNRWGNTLYILNHEPDFQLSQNGNTENQLSQNEDTQKQITQNKGTNNNNFNNNSLNNNIDINYICSMLNQAKEKAGSKGRLKPKGVEWFSWLFEKGITISDIVSEAERIARSGQDVDWYSFERLLLENEKGGK